MLVLLVITIASLTYSSIHSIITANREAELERLQNLVELMTTSQFPLTTSVLENMKLLSGADFIFTQNDGGIAAQTLDVPSTLPDFDTLKQKTKEQSTPIAIEADGMPYYYTAVDGIRDRNRTSAIGVLHILVPRKSERAVWWQASKSPLTIALLIMPLALLFSLALASQVTRPLATLNRQVHRIAEGDVQQIPEVQRNDEIRDLNVSINEMAARLQDHDTQLRSNERLRTMVQFGSGVAHHLRNSATGCKMAVELLRVEQQGIADSENYQVAIRQLGLMDNYIKKFLLLSKSSDSNSLANVANIRLGEVLDSVVFLLRPSAKHLEVELSVQSNCDDSTVRMSEEDAQQLMMNLITNAIRAASQNSASTKQSKPGFVKVELNVNEGAVSFSVTDNGSGPPEEISESIFDPFVTGSKEGTGLGLSLVQEISKRANGTVRWNRTNQLTTFSFESAKQLEAMTEA